MSQDRLIGLLLRAGRRNILVAAAALLVVTAFLDWFLGRNVSLAALYVLPMMVGAVVLRPAETAVFALLCSYLRFRFETSASPVEMILRFVFAALAYFLMGVFVTVLVKNHELVARNLAKVELEEARRREAEEQLRLLAESSPATILTVDRSGTVLAANGAAVSLFGIPDGETLIGRRIGKYLPVLDEALHVDVSQEGLRTAVECQGNRDNGDIFAAHIWFSSYPTQDSRRLAAIVVDSSEEMREREEQGLQQLMRGNRIAAAAVAHEVRNFCAAMTLLCGNLQQRQELAGDEDLLGLSHLLSGLETIASLDLKAKSLEDVEAVPLRDVLDNLRIVIEPAWRDIDGTIIWHLPGKLPPVVAEPRGLLQAFLNIVQNSHRAVEHETARVLQITVEVESNKVFVRFRDSGRGVAEPSRLFQPFQGGAAGSGMGLYVSRFIVRTYGGELRFDPVAEGACFVVELQAVSA